MCLFLLLLLVLLLSDLGIEQLPVNQESRGWRRIEHGGENPALSTREKDKSQPDSRIIRNKETKRSEETKKTKSERKAEDQKRKRRMQADPTTD